MKIIDAHVHLHDPRDPLPDHELFPGFDARTEDLIADHNEHGIDGAVLVPMNSKDRNLAYSQDASDRYPGDSAVLAIYDHDVDNPAAQYREDTESYEDLQGIRVQSLGVDPEDEDPKELDIWPLIEELEERDHCLWIYPALHEYELVDRIAEELPDLKVVYNLVGFPLPDGLPYYTLDDRGLANVTQWVMPEDFPTEAFETLLESGQRDNTYVLFGTHWQYSDESYPYRDLIEHSQVVTEAFGPDHTAFITDWPWMRDEPGYQECIDMVDIHLPELSEEERADILAGTAERLFWF